MAFFINTSQTIGIIIGEATNTTFGSIFLTLLFVVLVLMAMAIMFGIKLEYTMILIMPLMLSYMAYYQEFLAIGTIMIIYLSFILTKNFMFR